MISVAGVQCQSSSYYQLAATPEHAAVANQARRNSRIRIDIEPPPTPPDVVRVQIQLEKWKWHKYTNTQTHKYKYRRQKNAWSRQQVNRKTTCVSSSTERPTTNPPVAGSSAISIYEDILIFFYEVPYSIVAGNIDIAFLRCLFHW